MDSVKDMVSVPVTGADIAEGLIGEAAARGFAVSEEAEEGLADQIAAIRARAADPPSEEPAGGPEVSPEALEVPQTPGEQVEADAREELPNRLEDFSFNLAPVELEDEEETEEDFSYEQDNEPEAEEEDMYEDEDDLRRRLAKAEKALAHQTKLRVESNRKKWAAELKEEFPLASFDSLDASSRRDFKRLAAKSHNANYALLKPHIETMQEKYAELAANAKESARAEVAAAWGNANVGPNVSEVEEANYERELAAAQKSRNLSKIIGVKRKFGRL